MTDDPGKGLQHCWWLLLVVVWLQSSGLKCCAESDAVECLAGNRDGV